MPRFSPKQADVLLHADARWNILGGAVRSGKTHVSFDLILRRLAELPEGDRLLIGRTVQTVERNVLSPLRRRLGPRFVGLVNAKNAVRIAGKTFYVAGANNKEAVSKIQGMGLIYAYGDEITTWHPDVFHMLKSRLSDKGALFDGTCNPSYPTHWLKTDLLDRTDLDVKQWHFTIDDNPFLPPEYVAELKKEYRGVFYERYILGRWVRAEGLVYPMFAAETHVVPTEPRAYESYQISVDYGTYNPFHALLWGLCDGVWYCMREFRHAGREGRQKDPEQYGTDIDALAAGLPVSRILIDPSADAFITWLRHKGKHVGKARNDVMPGIECVAQCLNKGLIRINDCCEALIREFSLYVWDVGAQSADKPAKEHDHGLDALRYFAYTNGLTREKRRYFG